MTPTSGAGDEVVGACMAAQHLRRRVQARQATSPGAAGARRLALPARLEMRWNRPERRLWPVSWLAMTRTTMARPERERFEHLVRTCHAAVFRAARRLLADDAAAADVTQEVFLRVWTGRVRLDAADQPRAVLAWLAVRQAANTLRARRRRRDHETHAMHDHADSIADPVHDTARRDLAARAATLLDQLPADLRLPVQLRHQDELPLAAIGEALALPTSTVHDRIQRGLAVLRERLQRDGHGLAVAALPDLLGGAVPPPAPTGLEGRLLALPNLLPAAAAWSKALLVGLAGGVLAIGFAVARGGAIPEPIPLARSAVEAPAAAVVVRPPAEAGRREAVAQDPPPAPRPPTAAPTAPPAPRGDRFAATFTGTVHDASGAPVVGASVQPVAGGGYKPFELGQAATTDARGAFTVTARSDWLAATQLRLHVREHGRLLLDSGDLAVPGAGVEPAVVALVLPASAGLATTQYELAVTVRDEQGAALPGVMAVLYEDSGRPPSLGWRTRRDALATSDAAGVATVRGRGVGRRWLFVDGRPVGRASVLREHALTAGAQAVVVTLPTGGELTVQVTSVPGAVARGGKPWLVEDATELSLEPKRRGREWQFSGLGRGAYTLHAADAAVPGVTAAMGRATITVKDPEDTRDVGDHMAELHGELVDAATGEVVPFGPFEVEVHAHLADGSSLVSDGIEPPRPAQRMTDGQQRRAFRFTGLSSGRLALVASVPGYAIACQVFELQARDLRAGLRVPLQRPATVRGRVVDAMGQPVVGATVLALGTGPLADHHLEAWRAHRGRRADPGAADPSFTPLRSWTRDEGLFALTELPPETPLRLVAMHDELGFAVLALPPLRAKESAAELVLKLAPR